MKAASSRTPRLLHVVGARPNFMKTAPVLRALEEAGGTENVLLHSGQHYDANMSDAFFQDLRIRPPDIHLGVGSGTHGEQTARIMLGIEGVLLEGQWDCVVVVGDVNSTLAAALAASKLHVPVAHVEAGLRSGDRSMPEEINRILTDHVADLCLTPTRDADRNLRKEGIPQERIAFVGNVMIDSLMAVLAELKEDGCGSTGYEPGSYVVATLHRPSNVDHVERLREIVNALERIAREVPVVFPAHPRTARAMDACGLRLDQVRSLPPLGYRQMLALQRDAGLVITDSGGIQEETTVLGVPCLTLRSTTERPVTITRGTNRLVPDRTTASIWKAFEESWGRPSKKRIPEGWDGRAASRIRDVLHGMLGVA